MALLRWLGAAQAIAQISTVTITGTIAAGDTFTITIGNASLVYTAQTGDTTALVAEGLYNLCVGSTAPPQFNDVSFSYLSNVVTCTAAIAGFPFTISGSDTSAGGTLTVATPKASTGPNYWDNTANWSSGSLPINGDTVIIQQSEVDILFGLAQSAVTLAELNIDASFTGNIGLPNWNDTGYSEYRARYLAIGATKLLMGHGDGDGSSRIKINLGSVQTTALITSMANSDNDEPALTLLNTHASSAITVNDATLGIALLGEETSQVATINVGGNANVKLGDGVTIATVNNWGLFTSNSNVTTLTQESGNSTIFDAQVTTLTITGGTIRYRSSATITTATIGPGTLDLQSDLRARTITSCTLKKGAKIVDPGKTLTATGGIVFHAEVDQITAS